ncbi:MAG: hypothetical protein NTW03_00415, partial [Verrucomicrobia bacterium]|nr:hypothetical protein [Verrucomicrobiota bacterium]
MDIALPRAIQGRGERAGCAKPSRKERKTPQQGRNAHWILQSFWSHHNSVLNSSFSVHAWAGGAVSELGRPYWAPSQITINLDLQIGPNGTKSGKMKWSNLNWSLALGGSVD